MDKSSEAPRSRRNILLGISGSVASIKLRELVDLLSPHANVCIIPTQNSLHFVTDFESFNKQLPSLSDRLEFLKESSDANFKTTDKNMVFGFTDADEWSSWQKRSDPVLHIELKKWADILLVAPLDANTLAKFANGLCDNLLTCVARAWDLENIETKPVVVCPAMNTFMFKHPITGKQLRLLNEEFKFKVVDCVEKMLMCGDIGTGAMASVNSIVSFVKDLMKI